MRRLKEFWMDTDILDKALDNCDLGDGYSAKVRQYPHKDMLSQLTHVVEFSALEASQAREKILLDALEFYADEKKWIPYHHALTGINPEADIEGENGKKARNAIEKYNQAKAGSEK